jgi:murein DD-endopeptidase MepM/ murein hydrolase activator NlpD
VIRPSGHPDNHPSRTTATGRTAPSATGGRRSSRSRLGPLGSRRARALPLIVLAALLAGLIGGPASPVGADQLSDARARQQALDQQLQNQKDQVAKINALQADLGAQIASTQTQLRGINANLNTVRASIASMAKQIGVVKAKYLAQVAQLDELDGQLAQIRASEAMLQSALYMRKDLLADRLREAYDTDRTSMLETLLSGGSFVDVLSQVSDTIDVSEQDKALAEQIVSDQAAVAETEATIQDLRDTTDLLHVQTAAQRAKLNQQMAALHQAQLELKALEDATKKALAVQQAAYAKIARNKHNLAKAIAATNAAKRQLAHRINELVAAQYAHGNIPSQYNGTLAWPMDGTVTQDFGCTGVVFEPPLGSCAHFHQGIDIVAPYATAVHASGAGRVVYCGWNYADGADPAWIVIIAHSEQLETWYAHMVPSCPVPAGGSVSRGQVIGHEGNTGHSTGAHLHWAVRFNGDFVNPRLFL